jgi:hypothetical protein
VHIQDRHRHPQFVQGEYYPEETTSRDKSDAHRIRDYRESVHHCDKRAGIDDRPDKIETLSRTIRPFAIQLPEDEQAGDDPERDIDKEDAPPAEVLGQHPSQERAHGQSEIHGHDVDPKGFSPLPGREDR